MKRIYILFFTISLLGLTSSCTKDNSVKPATTQKTIVADKSDLGVGD